MRRNDPRCPYCREKYSYHRARDLERVAREQNVLVPCGHAGCDLKAPLDLAAKHEAECDKRSPNPGLVVAASVEEDSGLFEEDYGVSGEEEEDADDIGGLEYDPEDEEEEPPTNDDPPPPPNPGRVRSVSIVGGQLADLPRFAKHTPSRDELKECIKGVCACIFFLALCFVGFMTAGWTMCTLDGMRGKICYLFDLGKLKTHPPPSPPPPPPPPSSTGWAVGASGGIRYLEVMPIGGGGAGASGTMGAGGGGASGSGGGGGRHLYHSVHTISLCGNDDKRH